MISVTKESDNNTVEVKDPNIVPSNNIKIKRTKLKRPVRRHNLDEPTMNSDGIGIENDDMELLANARRMNNSDEDDAISTVSTVSTVSTNNLSEDDDMNFPTTMNGSSSVASSVDENNIFNMGGETNDKMNESDYGSGSGSGSDYGTASSVASSQSSVKSVVPKYKDVLQQKQELLYQLNKLESQGYEPSRKYNMASNVEQMDSEVKRLKHQRDMRQSIKFQRKILLAGVSGVCFLNNKFDPIGAKLDGWDKSVAEGINDYDEIFAELYDKYRDSIQMEPEIKLLMSLAGSGFMFHLQQSLFKSSNMNLDSILRQNPDLKANLEKAALNSAKQNAQTPFEHMAASNAQNFSNSRTQQSQSQMRGPPDIDEILKNVDAPRGVNIG